MIFTDMSCKIRQINDLVITHIHLYSVKKILRYLKTGVFFIIVVFDRCELMLFMLICFHSCVLESLLVKSGVLFAKFSNKFTFCSSDNETADLNCGLLIMKVTSNVLHIYYIWDAAVAW